MPNRRLTFKPMLVVFAGLMGVTAMVLNGLTWSRVKSSIVAVGVARSERDFWEDLLSTLIDAESGQRGYVITGDTTYLEPLESGLPKIEAILNSLRAGATTDGASLSEVASIHDLVVERVDLMKKVVVIREREGPEAAATYLKGAGGKQLMDRLRQMISARIVDRQLLVADATERMNNELRWGYASALGAALVAFGSGFVAFLLLRDALMHARREQRLAEEKRRAERADRDKSAFLATMSHEIRTPMNAILGFAELLRDRVDDERDVKYVEAILAGGRSLLQLINDILDLSRVEAGMLELHAEPTDLRATALFVRQLFFHLTAQRGVDFRVDVSEEIPRSLLFDNLRLRQVLINVVGNAVKFTNEGHVTLRIFGSPDQGDSRFFRVIVEVEDTGRGIPKDQLESIFKPFVQVDQDGRAGVPGTGLGLAIVHRLTRLMRGQITVESEVGRGSLFRFEFPEIELTSRLATPLDSGKDAVVDFNDFRPSRILVADDNPTNLELISGIFEGTHHTLLAATNGESAVEMAIKESPDLVLMDVRMPKMDGFEALAAIRGEEQLRLLPVIAVTASSLGSDEVRARKSFDGYLRKPYSRIELFRQIAQFVPLVGAEKSPFAHVGNEIHLPDRPGAASTWQRLAKDLGAMVGSELLGLRRTMSVSEIEGFAVRLRELGEATDCEPLLRYARELESDARSFSPDLMERTLDRLPDLVTAIAAAAEL